MFRIGQGFDVHAFAEGRPLIIGGITIPYEKGLLGHSDADVLLHTIADACFLLDMVLMWDSRVKTEIFRYRLLPIQLWNSVDSGFGKDLRDFFYVDVNQCSQRNTCLVIIRVRIVHS